MRESNAIARHCWKWEPSGARGLGSLEYHAVQQYSEGGQVNTLVHPLVSIVTPTYNTAEHLAECIESVIAQTYQNWEYSILDNCSSDASLKIARQYASRDSRIRVHENERFLAPIQNHNAALRLISSNSKYCKMVFADDWIFPECLEKMVAIGEEHPTAGLIGAYCLEGRQVICTGLPYSRNLIDGRATCREHLLSKLHLFGSANSLLYRADLVKNKDPFFNEANINADTEVCFDLLRTADFGFVHQVLTFTRLRPGSLNTVSLDIHTDLPAALRILKTYGQNYLTATELETLIERQLTEYYQFLGKCIFQRRDRKFWDYHRKQLTELGFGFDRVRLFRSTFGNLLLAATDPKSSIDKLSKYWTLRCQARGDRACGDRATAWPAVK